MPIEKLEVQVHQIAGVKPALRLASKNRAKHTRPAPPFVARMTQSSPDRSGRSGEY